MASFMNDDFLLRSQPARRLFHEYAQAMPIYDFHSHLPPREVTEDSHFENVAQVWLGGDHYKWRAMRANGVSERYITGDASDYEKFLAWAQTVPKTVGNPLYHWTHLELKRYFGIDEILNETSARRLWDQCNQVLAQPSFSVRGLLRLMNVRLVCTTDDPSDRLEYHESYVRQPGDPVLVPAFRPDKILACANSVPWHGYLKSLEATSGISIGSFADLIRALDARHKAFHAAGGRLSDHGLERPPAVESTAQGLEKLTAKLLKKRPLSSEEIEAFQTGVLKEVGRMNAERGWTMQLHLGAIRNLNTRMRGSLGPDTGFDAIGDERLAKPLAQFLDLMAQDQQLPRLVLYTVNPSWNEVIASIAGCFEDGSAPGRVQFGSAWWFNDQIEGMRRQLTTLSHFGLLSRFVGMLTDSRSFLSFPRHEYFRRILCDLVGGWVEAGEAPADYELLGNMVRDVSYRNAFQTFKIPGVDAV